LNAKALVRSAQNPLMQGPLSVRARLLALAVTVAIGLLVGTVGFMVSGRQAWLLAVPACLAVAWWALADPTRCVTEPGRGERSRQGADRRD
jgi:hypothetical protein